MQGHIKHKTLTSRRNSCIILSVWTYSKFFVSILILCVYLNIFKKRIWDHMQIFFFEICYKWAFWGINWFHKILKLNLSIRTYSVIKCPALQLIMYVRSFGGWQSDAQESQRWCHTESDIKCEIIPNDKKCFIKNRFIIFGNQSRFIYDFVVIQGSYLISS